MRPLTNSGFLRDVTVENLTDEMIATAPTRNRVSQIHRSRFSLEDTCDDGSQPRPATAPATGVHAGRRHPTARSMATPKCDPPSQSVPVKVWKGIDER